MATTIIEQFQPKAQDVIGICQQITPEPLSINISEMFCDTIQGEGIWSGQPAMFMRMQGCTLDCVWCDTSEVWRKGNSYTFAELLYLFGKHNVVNKLKAGQHLVLTGGSPLKQQDNLVKFIQLFIQTYGFKPYIEVENECVLKPTDDFVSLVDCWNNSPKLANSGMKQRARWKFDIIDYTANLKNSWFKFVVDGVEDWEEIVYSFFEPGLIHKDQVILMPQGQTQEELAKSREIAADMAVRHGVRFSDRLHITLWDKRTGV